MSPHKMGRHIVFSFVVCLSVRPTVCPSNFRVRSISLNPWWDLQIILHNCQVWWDDVQFLGLTKVGSRSRSQSKSKHCMTLYRVRSISFDPLVGFYKLYCLNDSYNGTMCSTYVWPRLIQGQGQNLRLTLYDRISCQLYIFWTPNWIYK